MSLIYPLTLPSHQFLRVTITGRSAVASNRSPFSFAQQTYVHPGQMWRASVELPRALTRDQAQPWISTLLGLNGKEGTFLLGDPLASVPLGSALGDPVVDGSGQSGGMLTTRGWSAGEVGVLLAGDYLQVGSGSTARLYMALHDVDADASGMAAIKIWPNLRESPQDGQLLTLTNTRGVFRLASNRRAYTIEHPYFYRVSFDAVEAL